MIESLKILQAERLLADGKLSQRKIAAIVGIGRATVSAIVAGKRSSATNDERGGTLDNGPPGPVERCRGCGGMVYTPCRLCRVRKVKAHEEALARAFRRHAREQKLKRLLTVLRNASRAREAAGGASGYLPVAADSGPSDCK